MTSWGDGLGPGAEDATEQLTLDWARAVHGTSYVSMGETGLRRFLRPLAAGLFAAVAAEPFSPEPGAAVGKALVEAHFTSPETLRQTIAVLGERLPAMVHSPPALAQQLAGRTSRLVGALAASYAQALQDRTRAEQDAIQAAMMRAREAAEHGRREADARFRAVFADAAIGIGIGDLDGRIIDVNDAMLDMFGYPRDQLMDLNITTFLHPSDDDSVWSEYAQLIAGELDHYRMEKQYFRADGGSIWTNLTVSLIRRPDGRPSYQVCMMEDVTERRRLQTGLEHQAFHDSLTGLPNRAMLMDRIAEVLTRPPGSRVGLCFLDVDGFKSVNDSLGHVVGDQLLVAIADRLAGSVAPGQLLARIGGDEFIILVTDPRDAEEVAAAASAALGSLAEPIDVGGHRLLMSASAGVLERSIDDADVVGLVRAADITLRWAKDEGKGRWVVYEPQREARTITRHTLSSSLSSAIEEGQFALDYQPLLGLAGGEVQGVEALVRWRHPRFGLLTPDEFISIAEETGHIVPLGRWVLERACEQAVAWREQTGFKPFVSVNLAVRQCREPTLVEGVEQILQRTGLDPAYLQLEITESALVDAEGMPLEALDALSGMGIRIAIDDFGTGYSNLSYLTSLPIHDLKLASWFTARLRETTTRSQDADRHIVAAMVDLAHTLGLTVTAEGVETAVQADRLREVSCDAGQGFYFCRPGAAEQITALLLTSGTAGYVRTAALAGQPAPPTGG